MNNNEWDERVICEAWCTQLLCLFSHYQQMLVRHHTKTIRPMMPQTKTKNKFVKTFADVQFISIASDVDTFVTFSWLFVLDGHFDWINIETIFIEFYKFPQISQYFIIHRYIWMHKV